VTIRFSVATRALVVVAVCGTLPRPAAALARTWVSPTGNNANTCDQTAPCRTFFTAITKTDPGGEIDAMGPADYGVVTINKSVTIDGGAGLAGITTVNSTAIDINAGPNDAVTLRNLSLSGAGMGPDGIAIANARSVLIEHCSISGFGTGVFFQANGPVTVTITDTTIHNNSIHGIEANSIGPFYARLTATRVRLTDNGNGMYLVSNALAYVTDSIASNNTGNGFYVVGTVATQLSLEGTSSSHNGGAGVVSQNPFALVRLSNSTIDHNVGVGLLAFSGGQILSYGNNRVSANGGGDGSPTGMAPPM
jgi:hypothetical protein